MDFTKLASLIPGYEKKMVALESLLTSVPALGPENGGQGEAEKCAALEGWLRRNGFSDLKHFDAPDDRVESGFRPNLVATIPGKRDDFAVWVMAHLDVVPPGDMAKWETDPWKVVEKNGRLYGRGVEDNQQGLVSAVFAAKAFIDNDIKPAHTVKLLFMADEEVGSRYGIQYLLRTENLFRKDDILLIPDGGDSAGKTIEIAEKDVLWLRLHTIGKQTHGSRPDEGANACLAADDLALRLHALEKIFDKKDPLFAPSYSTFQPTMRLANVDGVNIIPGDDVFCMDCRILPCYALSEVMEKVTACCQDVEKHYGVKIEIEKLQSEESPATPADAPVVVRLSAAIKAVHNLDAQPVGIGGGTVGAYLRSKGYNAAVWSTMDERAHTPNEYCIIKNIVSDAQTLAVLMAAD
ncbi:MAG: M20 family metallo-hydrolase [Treponema sp.]|jgi:succinyl-diaminopimelate desuccinylase|nr:M20 family metallo-hydrolase [Treponema sp.]